ncbi:MAG: hypothetical protein V4739_05850 [Pseudomonadota bacterium]
MFALFDRCYSGGSPALFAADLARKSHVIELREGGLLQGFSTIEVFDVEADAGAARGVFSGDTIVHHDHWGTNVLAQAFCAFAGTLKRQRPAQPLYWLLISKGQRTYRYLSLFARDYFPHPERTTPAPVQTLMGAVARERFGAFYDPAAGVLRMRGQGTRLRPQWAAIRPPLQNKPEVAYFLQRNPGHLEGDELVCWCELSEANLLALALREFRRGLPVMAGASPAMAER